jgi:hypothetical protein
MNFASSPEGELVPPMTKCSAGKSRGPPVSREFSAMHTVPSTCTRRKAGDDLISKALACKAFLHVPTSPSVPMRFHLKS